MHPWHDCYVDDTIVESAFPVVIEVPKGSKNKYELDKETGLQRGSLSRGLRLHSADVL
jgi:inorganic pyrophosphatase